MTDEISIPLPEGPLDAGCLEPMTFAGGTHVVSFVGETPWPPSKNGYWRAVAGRIIVSKMGRRYRNLAAIRVRETLTLTSSGKYGVKYGDIVPLPNGLYGVRGGLRVCLRVILHPPDRRKRDISNHIMALQDVVEELGLIPDDEIIDYQETLRHPVDTGDGFARFEVAVIRATDKGHRCLCRERGFGGE